MALADGQYAVHPPPGAFPPGGKMGCAWDDHYISVREASDGVIAASTVVADFQGVTDGWIYVAEVPTIAIYVNIDIGSLTSASVLPFFSMDQTTEFQLVNMDSAGPNLDIDAGDGFNLIASADADGVVVLPNPCCKWFRLKTLGSGTTTGSDATLHVMRGYQSMSLI